MPQGLPGCTPGLIPKPRSWWMAGVRLSRKSWQDFLYGFDSFLVTRAVQLARAPARQSGFRLALRLILPSKEIISVNCSLGDERSPPFPWLPKPAPPYPGPSGCRPFLPRRIHPTVARISQRPSLFHQPRAEVLASRSTHGHDAPMAIPALALARHRSIPDEVPKPPRRRLSAAPCPAVRQVASWRVSGASIPCSRSRWPCISSVSPSITHACPERAAACGIPGVTPRHNHTYVNT